MKMESGSLGNLSNQNQKTNLEKHLDFQEAVRPEISEAWFTSAIDFIARMYSTEYYTGKNYNAFPQEFRTYVSDMSVPYNTIFEEYMILENEMATLRVKGLKFREDFLEELAQLKEKGIEKII